MPRGETRTEHVHVVATSAEKRMAEELAAEDGDSVSALVRRLVRERHMQRFGGATQARGDR